MSSDEKLRTLKYEADKRFYHISRKCFGRTYGCRVSPTAFFSVFYALAIQHHSLHSCNKILLKQRVSRMNGLIYDILVRWSKVFHIFKKSINLSQTNRSSRIESISFRSKILVLVSFDKLKIDCHAYNL